MDHALEVSRRVDLDTFAAGTFVMVENQEQSSERWCRHWGGCCSLEGGVNLHVGAHG